MQSGFKLGTGPQSACCDRIDDPHRNTDYKLTTGQDDRTPCILTLTCRPHPQTAEMADLKTRPYITQVASDWLERGVFTIPLKRNSKEPKSKRWPHLRLAEEDFDNGVFKDGDNIGGLWGDASDHIIDVDLDMEEACDVAPHIIPETYIYGRTGKERSHYLYRVVGAKTKKYMHKELGMVVEIRSTGSQSVLPPSRHPEGGRYFTHPDDDVEFTELTQFQLERYIEEVVCAAIFLKYYPEEGSRHDYVHAATGALCHQDWSEEKIKRVMGAVLSCMQFEDEELQQRIITVTNTIERHHTGDRTRGFTSLEDWIKPSVLSRLRLWTQAGKKESQLLAPAPRLKPVPEKLEFDESLLEVPGLVGDITKWARRFSYIEQPAFALATGITCTAIASCNSYLVQAWDTPLQPYLMCTAATGNGKKSLTDCVMKFADRLGMDDVVFQGFQSYYVMLDVLGELQQACWIWDEAARHIASAKKSSSPDFQVLTHVLSLYGSAGGTVAGRPGRRNPIPTLHNPFLTLLATAQPDVLMDAITTSAEETGFINRFVLFDTGDEFAPINENRIKMFPSAITKQAKLLRDYEPDPHGKNEGFTEIPFDTTRTYSRFREFEEISRRRGARGELTWVRSNQNALILAGLLAVGVSPHQPVIDSDMADWAIKLVSWSNQCWTEKLRLTASGEDPYHRDSAKVMRIISNPQKYIHQKMLASQRLCLRDGVMPHSLLLRRSKLKARQLEEILDTLTESEEIGSTEQHDNTCYFVREDS